jgi:hypothetical protein
MYKHFGFYLPDSEFLQDPEGLLKYLGAKLAYGKVGASVVIVTQLVRYVQHVTQITLFLRVAHWWLVCWLITWQACS